VTELLHHPDRQHPPQQKMLLELDAAWLVLQENWWLLLLLATLTLFEMFYHRLVRIITVFELYSVYM
jgi:hypothetical protein